MEAMTKRQRAYLILETEGRMDAVNLAKKVGVSPGEASNFIEGFHYKELDIQRVPDRDLEQQAINRFLEWKNAGAKLDHLGRLPLELLSEIQIAKKHGYEIRDNIHSRAKSA